MKTLAFALIACAAFAQEQRPNIVNAKFESRAFSGDLAAQLRAAAPTWFAYAIKTTRKDHQNCCWNNGNECGCRLEGGWGPVTGVSASNTPIPLEGSDVVAVLFRVSNNDVGKIQVYSLSCPLDAGGLPFVWLTGVPAESSVDFLEKLVTGGSSTLNVDGPIFAIAQHDSARADVALERLTRPTQPEKIREKVTFWLGASRGASGVSALKKIMANDPSEHVRDKAVFALSISKQPEALDSLIAAAKNDASSHVRGQALFWLAHKAGERASSTITNAIENDPDTGVKKRAVFALSQLPQDEAVPKLIEIARTQKNPEVRKQAFFWLGQSHDPRVLAFFEQVLVK
ncbi:MAG TPA: HEAT repeat domain-containing protein [Bryobacteraceae bacterium]|jgi:hypothetical protein